MTSVARRVVRLPIWVAAGVPALAASVLVSALIAIIIRFGWMGALLRNLATLASCALFGIASAIAVGGPIGLPKTPKPDGAELEEWYVRCEHMDRVGGER